MNEYVNIFKSLSDMTRLRIFHLLVKAGKELCICEIMDSLELAQYNVSRHIRELKLAGLVTEKKQGKFVFYSVSANYKKCCGFLIQAIKSIPEEHFKKDDCLLKKRLALRVQGKCIVGMLKK
jgi:ArsR family transcriptional regulator